MELFADNTFEARWDPDWLPVVQHEGNLLFVACSAVTPVGTVAVRRWQHTPEDPFSPVAGSWTAVVETWVYLIENRYVWWSNETSSWEDRWEAIPMPMKVWGPT